MILLVTDVEYKGNHTLICEFNNSAKKEVDLTPSSFSSCIQGTKR